MNCKFGKSLAWHHNKATPESIVLGTANEMSVNVNKGILKV
jgi:hypothetical protein